MLILSLLACKGQPAPSPLPFEIEVDPPQLVIAAGQTAQAEVTVSRDADLAVTVALTWVGAPPGLPAAFATAEVGDASTTLTVAPDATLIPATYQGWVRGEAAGQRVAVPLEIVVEPGPLKTVRGVVIDPFRSPRAGMPVALGEALTTTDVDGRFEVPDVDGAYDVRVYDATNDLLHVYEGLTRPDPVIQLVDKVPDWLHADVSGAVTGGAGYPQDLTHVTGLGLASDDVPNLIGFTGLYGKQGPAFGPLVAAWYGASTVSGTLHALQWEINAAWLPVTYTGYGTRAITLQAGVAAPGQDVALAPVDTGYLAGTVTVPLGHTLTGKGVWLQVSDASSIPLVAETTPDATFTYAVPRLTQTTLGVEALVEDAVGGSSALYLGALSPQEVVDLEPPAAPALIEPASGAALSSDAATFRWTAYPGAVHLVTWLDVNGGPSVSVYTARSSIALDELPVELDAQEAHLWGVWGMGPAADLDAFAGPDGGLSPLGLRRDVRFGVSEVRAFTTAP